MTIPAATINLSELILRQISEHEAKSVLAIAHYLPQLRKTTRATHGILAGNKLIGALIYGLPTYAGVSAQYHLKPRNVLELVRFAVLPGYNISNMVSWALSRSVRLIKRDLEDVQLLISFADPHFGHSGHSYLAAGWVDAGETEPSYYYTDMHGNIIHKRTLWDHAKKMGADEASYAAQRALTRVDTPPKRKFIRWLRHEPVQVREQTATINAACSGPCGKTYVVRRSAYERAIGKHGAYLCQPCSVKALWADQAYRERRKHLDYSDKEQYINVQCVDCTKSAQLKKKSLTKVFRRYGNYVCHGCAMVRYAKTRI